MGKARLGASWGRHRDPPGNAPNPQRILAGFAAWRALPGSLTPHFCRDASPWSTGAAALPGSHVAPGPRCRCCSVSFRVAHLKFQLAGCFRAGGMQNQPTNTNKYLLYPPPPTPASNSRFHSYFPAGFGGENGFSKLSVNVCNNRKRCLLACGRHSFK